MRGRGIRLRNSSFLVLACCMAFVGYGSTQTDLRSLEARLREQMVGKVAVLRNFYKNSDLTFDSSGNLIGNSKTGPWTYYARIEVTSLNLTEKSLIVKGSRNVVRWELSASEFQNYTLSDHPVRIAIQLEPGFTQNSLAAVISKVFLTRDTPLSDIVPDYWKELLTTNRERRAKWDEKKSTIMKTVADFETDVSIPQLESRAEGIETSPHPFKELMANNLALSFIVDQNGKVEQVDIEKPVGLGLDDPIAETILQWKWKPATKGNSPVAVLMHAKILFPAEKGHIDPYHTQPCPNLPNVMQC